MKETDMITVRYATLEDIDRLLEIYAYYVEKTAISFEYDVPSKEEFTRRFERITAKYPFIAAEKDGKTVGYTYAGDFVGRSAYAWSAELTVYIDKDYLKCGVGKALYTKLEEDLKAMGITNLYACIGVPSEDDRYLTRNSIDFHEHFGFVQIGQFHNCGYKFGNWYDMVWAEKIVGKHTGDMKNIIPFPQLKR